MKRAALWCAAAFVLSACGKNEITSVAPAATPTLTATSTAPSTRTATVTSTAAPTPTSAPQHATLLFSADASNPANPFPSDRLLDASGHVQVPASYLDPGLPATAEFQTAHTYLQTIAGQLTTLSGFGTFSPIKLRFDRLVTVSAGENPKGILLLEYNDLSAAPPAITASAYNPEHSIEVRPVRPLKPKTTYALVVTSALADADGNPIQPSADFAQLLAGTNLNPDLTAWRARLQPVIAFVNSAFGIAPNMLALVDLFTTQPTTDDLIAIQQRLTSGDLTPGLPVFVNPPLGNLDTGIFAEGTPQYTSLIGASSAPNVAAVAIGVFDSYDFREASGGPFAPRFVNGPDVPRVNHLDFYMTIPKAPKPPGGYPIMIYGHGLGGSGRDIGPVMRDAPGDAPVVGIAISEVQHGRRGTEGNFFVLKNIWSTRENFRQSVADFMQEARMIENAHAAGIAPFDQIDPQHIEYRGVSLGGIIGTVFMAVDPAVQVGMLSVPGGGLANILDSNDIGSLLDPLISLQVTIPIESPFFPRFLHAFQSLTQWALESADPIAYAPYMIVPGMQLPGVPPKRILMHEGVIDNTIPNRTTDDLALAMHLPDLKVTRGCTDPDGCSGIWRFVMTAYGQPELSGHSATSAIPQASAQAVEYLNSLGTHVTDASP